MSQRSVVQPSKLLRSLEPGFLIEFCRIRRRDEVLTLRVVSQRSRSMVTTRTLLPTKGAENWLFLDEQTRIIRDNGWFILSRGYRAPYGRLRILSDEEVFEGNLKTLLDPR